MPFFLIRPLIYAASVILVIGGLTYSVYRYGYKLGADKIQKEWDAEKISILQAQQEQLLIKDKKERQLQTRIDKLQAERQREITNLNTQLNAVLDQLRGRPDRTTGSAESMPGVTSSGHDKLGCTGNELYRSDAEFLIREAERADHLRLALKRCESAYDSAKAQQ